MLSLLPRPAEAAPAFAGSLPNCPVVNPARPVPPPRVAAWVAAVLLALYAAMAWTASWEKGVSFDEGLQLAVGYNLWLNRDFRMEGANGDLIKRWATLPYLVTRPKFVDHQDAMWQRSRAYDVGWKFFFELGNRPESLLRPARAMITVLGVLTGLLIFRCSRRLFGWRGGLLSLTVFVFSPTMLAFGGVVSTDMSITLTLFAATWWLWRILHEVTSARLAGSLAWIALLVLAKPTALVIFPIAAVLVTVRLAAGSPLILRWRARRWSIAGWRAQAATIAVMAFLHIAAGWAALWAHYDFRYTASSEPGNPALVFFTERTRDHVPVFFGRSLQWMQRTKFLPEGFLHGIDALLGCDDELAAFKNGEWKMGGWRSFFPYAIGVKTPPALFGLLGLAAWFWWRRRHEIPAPPDLASARSEEGATLYALTPHLALIGCYLAIAMTEDLNIGHRHVLPLYPSLYVLAGAAAWAWERNRVAWRLVPCAAIAWLCIESIAIRPHYLAYFGPQAGGPQNGFRHLVDSSVDWGMNLPGLKKWLAVHNPRATTPVFLAYFGNDNPRYYGIKAKLLPGFFERRDAHRYSLTPGYYVISASLLESVYTSAFGPWSPTYERMYWEAARAAAQYEAALVDPARRRRLLARAGAAYWENTYDRYENLRLARLCAWLRRRRPPDDSIGYGLLIWNLSEADLRAALLDPPVESVDHPVVLRPWRTFTAAR